jgi:uncharacterized metal-binding protein
MQSKKQYHDTLFRGSGTAGSMKALITCSGLSNTGRLTTQVAMILVSRSPETVAWVQAHADEHRIADCTTDAEEIIVIDGCSDHCATKKCKKEGIIPHHHIVATDLGVKKDGLADVQWDDVEKVLAAVEQESNRMKSGE